MGAVTKHVDTESCGDDELDAIALCIKSMPKDMDSKRRVIKYLNDRFGMVLQQELN